MSIHSQTPQHLVNGDDIQFEYNLNVNDGSTSKKTKKKKKKKSKSNQSIFPLPTLVGQDLNDPDFKYPDSRILKQNSNGDVIVQSLEQPMLNTSINNNSKLKPNKKNQNTNDSLLPEDPELLNQELKEYWLSLSSDEKKDMLNAERKSVFKVIKEHQKITCNCSVCSRKRQIIEKELKKLYEAYFEGIDSDELITAELFNDNPPQNLRQLQNQKLQQQQLHNHHLNHQHIQQEQKNLQHQQQQLLQHQQQLQLQQQQAQHQLQLQLQQAEQQKHQLKPFQLQQLELLQQKAQAVQAQALGKSTDYENLNKKNLAKDEIASLNSWLISDSLRVSIKKSGDTRLNGILSVAEDLVENDGRKFLEMMEKLAESRIERQSQISKHSVNINNINRIEEDEDLEYSNNLPEDDDIPNDYFNYDSDEDLIEEEKITELSEDEFSTKLYNILDPIWNIEEDSDEDPEYFPSDDEEDDDEILEEYYSDGITDEDDYIDYLDHFDEQNYSILDSIWEIEEDQNEDPDFIPSIEDEEIDHIVEEYYSEGLTDIDNDDDDEEVSDDNSNLRVDSLLNYPLSFIESHFKKQNELQLQLEHECKELERLEDELCDIEGKKYDNDDELRDTLQRYENDLLKKYPTLIDKNSPSSQNDETQEQLIAAEKRLAQAYLEDSDISDEEVNIYEEDEDDEGIYDDEEDDDDENQFGDDNDGSEFEESVMDEEQHLEEGRAMLQLCTTKMLRQSLLASYKKKKQEEALKALVEDLDDEEEKEKAKQEKKHRQREKQREKKKLLQQQKEAERLEKEAIEERIKKEKEEEKRRKDEEKRKKREQEERKALEEKRRKDAELEKIKREKQEKRRLLEAQEEKKRIEKKQLEEKRKAEEEAIRLKKEKLKKEKEEKLKKEEKERLKKEEEEKLKEETLPSFEKLSIQEEPYISQSSSSTHLYDSIYQNSPFLSNSLLNNQQTTALPTNLFPIPQRTPEPQFYPNISDPSYSNSNPITTSQPASTTSGSPWSKGLSSSNLYNSFNFANQVPQPQSQSSNVLPVNQQNGFTIPQNSNIDLLPTNFNSNSQVWPGANPTWTSNKFTPPFNQAQDLIKDYQMRIFTAYMLSQPNHLEGGYMPIDQLYSAYISYNGQEVSFELFNSLIQQTSPDYQFSTLIGNNGDISYVKITSYLSNGAAAAPGGVESKFEVPQNDYLGANINGVLNGSIWN